jgi:hypothetical protein
MYRFVDRKTYLDWGLTSDWQVSGPRKRCSTQSNSQVAQLKYAETNSISDLSSSNIEADNSASEGYGEMTEGSIERLFCFLIEVDSFPPPFSVATPPKKGNKSISSSFTQNPCRLNSRVNTFIDIGSGYGKVVFHAKLGGKFSHSVGIEYVESRANLASTIRDELMSQKNSLLNSRSREMLRSCVLIHADATTWKSFNFSHIYMYDRVFSANTLNILAERLNNSSFEILITYRRFEEWLRLGLKNVKLLNSITMRTTGGQNFRAYILLKVL